MFARISLVRTNFLFAVGPSALYVFAIGPFALFVYQCDGKVYAPFHDII